MAEAVAGWLVCPIIKIVMDKAKRCASDRIKWLSDGVPKSLKRMEDLLLHLRAVASAVQRRGSPDRCRDLRAWLQQLMDAVYEAQDVLDDFDESVPPPESPIARAGKRIFGADERVNRLRDVLEKLEAAYKTSSTLIQAAETNASPSREASGHLPLLGGATSSMRHSEHVVFGRDRELQDMVSWLLAAIMGHGGMGKTTLAQLLFNDQEVMSSFEPMIWVQPAATDDVLELTKQILQSADVDVPDGMSNFNLLQKKLKERVSQGKFLLVIDDVWNKEDMRGYEYREMWSKVLAPLGHEEARGSKIVITTRQKIVANLLPAVDKEVWLDDLPPDDIWSLFKRCAFRGEDIEKQPRALQDIARKIAEKLKGSPMVAKAVGQMLEGRREVSDWRKVLEMDIFDSVSKTLELCYHNLPEHLQPCFAICSLFPKNWRFKRDKLVKIWMALDFIQAGNAASGRAQLEDVGSDYFDQLVARSFFHRQKVGRQRYYYIHDLMHDLAEKVSRFDCVRVEDANKEIPKTIRHLSVSSDTVAQLKNRCELKRLRTLLILKNPSSSLDQLSGDLLSELKVLRVLGLEGCNNIRLSERVGNLRYLRYLALCKSVTKLPQSVTKLYRLQTFSSPKGSGLDVPEDIVNLKRLRHLDMDTSKINGIGKLVHLQGSVKFHVKNEKGHTLGDLDGMRGLRKELHIKNLDVVPNQEEACQAGLKKKENVKVLELEWNSSGKSMPSVEAEVLDGLEPNQYVKRLIIRRYHGDRSPNWLNTSGFYFKYLHLINCRKWEVLPPLGQLPCLKVLHLKEMCAVKKISCEFYGTNSTAFPCLEELEFDDMPQWVEWTQEENILVLPKLRKLKLLNCPELIKVPCLPLSVRKVSVKNTGFVSQLKISSSSRSKACKFALDTCSASVLTNGLMHQQQVEAIAILTLRSCQDVKFEELQVLTSLKRLLISHSSINDEQLGTCLRGLQSLTWLEISNCNNITCLPHVESSVCLTKFHELHIQQCSEFSSLHSLPSYVALESILIENCSKITVESFPSNFSSINTLRKLSLMNCIELELLPSGFPSSLQVLHLIGCNSKLMNQLQLKDGPEWDKIASIPIKQIR